MTKELCAAILAHAEFAEQEICKPHAEVCIDGSETEKALEELFDKAFPQGSFKTDFGQQVLEAVVAFIDDPSETTLAHKAVELLDNSVMTVESSHGTFKVHQLTGTIIEKDLDGEYENVVRFDVAEYRKWTDSEGATPDADILCIGYWFLDGNTERYEAPEADYRRECRVQPEDLPFTEPSVSGLEETLKSYEDYCDRLAEALENDDDTAKIYFEVGELAEDLYTALCSLVRGAQPEDQPFSAWGSSGTVELRPIFDEEK